jgi:hypothetical protein
MMEKCNDNEQIKQNYPDVKPGDIVKNAAGKYFLVVGGGGKADILYSLKDGNVWNSGSLWGTFYGPSQWQKVNCCFKEC